MDSRPSCALPVRGATPCHTQPSENDSARRSLRGERHAERGPETRICIYLFAERAQLFLVDQPRTSWPSKRFYPPRGRQFRRMIEAPYPWRVRLARFRFPRRDSPHVLARTNIRVALFDRLFPTWPRSVSEIPAPVWETRLVGCRRISFRSSWRDRGKLGFCQHVRPSSLRGIGHVAGLAKDFCRGACSTISATLHPRKTLVSNAAHDPQIMGINKQPHMPRWGVCRSARKIRSALIVNPKLLGWFIPLISTSGLLASAIAIHHRG